MAKEWDESKHPRTPKGHGDKSGEWRSSLDFNEEEFNTDAQASMDAMENALFPPAPDRHNWRKFSGELKDEMERKLLDRLSGNPDWDEYVKSLISYYRGEEYVVSTEMQKQEGYQEIKNMIDDWASASSDSNYHSQLMQHIAARVFGIKDAFDHSSLAKHESDKKQVADFDQLARTVAANSHVPVDVMLKGRAVFLREMYKTTQEQLKAAGITDVYLARGTTHKNVKLSTHDQLSNAYDKVHGIPIPPAKYTGPRVGYQKIRITPMSSFSVDVDAAYSFAQMTQATTGLVTYVKVPASRILSTPRSGYGCYSEKEVVVLGGTLRGLVTRPTKLRTSDSFVDTQAAWAASQ